MRDPLIRMVAAGADDNAADELIISELSHITAAEGSATAADYGYKWRVQIIDAGPDKTGRLVYPKEVLVAAAPLYEGARVMALSEGQHADGKSAFGKSVRDIVGWLADVAPNATGLEGTLNLVAGAKWLRDNLVDAWEKGKKDLFALSHDVLGRTETLKTGVRQARQIVKVDSVDVVYDPIGGGKFLRMAAAGQASQKEELMWQRLLAALKGMRPNMGAQIDALIAKGDVVSEAEIQTLLAAAMKADGEALDMQQLVAAVNTSVLADAKKLVDEATRIGKENADRMTCAQALNDELAGSKLPELTQARIKKQFEGQIFDVAALKAAVVAEKEYLDKMLGSGRPTDVGGMHLEVQGEPERMQAAMDKLLGVVVDAKFGDVPALTSLRAAYVRMTGDTQITGLVDPSRMQAAYSSSSFTYVLGNSLYRRLVQDYQSVEYFEDILVSYYRNALDFRTMESINVGYFSDLADVNPENADYAELTMPTDEEMSYALNQKGGILTINRKVIINDDLRSVQALVGRVGRAAKRTYARRIWNKLISNATYKGDSKALFHADHNNLGSVAFTNDATGLTTLTNRIIAMYGQTEKDSGEGLGLQAKYEVGPRALLELMKGVNSPWPGVAGGNPHAGRFGAGHENIVTTPLFTDATDWYLVADKNDVELLEVAFLNGVREPQMFVADNPAAGQMFVADKIQYKIRHEYEVEIADFRGFGKSVVAG